MAQAAPARSVTVTAAYEPRARSSRARTKTGTLRKEARQWRDGLAWSAKLQLLGSPLSLEPPYDVTVHAYFPHHGAEELPGLQDWFEGITAALAEALGVEPAQVRLKTGRVGYTPPFSPPHFEIVITAADDTEVALPLSVRVTCPACWTPWALEPAAQAGDRCPHCGHEDAGLPFVLGLV